MLQPKDSPDSRELSQKPNNFCPALLSTISSQTTTYFWLFWMCIRMQIKNSFNLGKKKTFSLNIVALPEIIIFLKKKRKKKKQTLKVYSAEDIFLLLRRSAMMETSSRDWETLSLGSQWVVKLHLGSSLSILLPMGGIHSVTSWHVISRWTPRRWLPSCSCTSKNVLTSSFFLFISIRLFTTTLYNHKLVKDYFYYYYHYELQTLETKKG